MVGELHQTGGLVAHGAQRFLEHDRVKLFDVGFERLLQVLFVEELGVVQAGAHDALVAVANGVGAGRVAVAHDDEAVGELVVGVVKREVALVHEHRVDDDLFGYLQELFVERAAQGCGVFGKVHHFE